MRRAVIGLVGLTLTACGAQIMRQYDMTKVEADFKACMNATGAPTSDFAFSRKIDACKSVAWAAARARSYS